GKAKHLRITPRPRGFDTLAVAREYDDDGRGRDAYPEVMLWGDFQRGQSYAITVDEQLRDIYGQPLVGEPSFEVAFIEPPPILKLHKAAGTFSSTHGFEVGIESRYVERAKLRVALLDHATHERLIGTNVQEDGWPIGLAATHEQPITLAHTGKFGWS